MANGIAASDAVRRAMLVSVITPTLDEAANVRLRAAELACEAGPWEWIVVDAHSGDGTAAVAAGLGARIVHANANRGGQLHAGAAVACGEALLFLHADTELPAGALAAVRTALCDAHVVGGNFRLRFDGAAAAGRWFARIYAFDQRVLRIYFGDSAIFVRRAVYARIGGFRPHAVMEDYVFVRALEAAGRTVRLPLAVVTSSRRFRGRPLRAATIWLAMTALYHCGIAPERLAQLYRGKGGAASRHGSREVQKG